MIDCRDIERLRQDLLSKGWLMGTLHRCPGKAGHHLVEVGQTCLVICRDFKYTITAVAD